MIDFGAFHEDVDALLAAHADVVARRPDGLEPLTIAVDGEAVTYRVVDGGVEVAEGSGGVVVALSAEAFGDFVEQLRSAFGLLYAQLVDGPPDALMRWEATLRAVWSGQDPALPEVEPCDPDAPLAEQLSTQGFALVREVFTPDEVAVLRAEVDRLTRQARPDDRRSWWARDAEGTDVCCRLLYTEERSDEIPAIVGDGRLADLLAPVGEAVVPAEDRFDGYSVVMKPPGIVEGLADLPWHRDCGLGGHSVMCPLFNVGVQLEAATEETGRLDFVPGSHASAWWPLGPRDLEGRPTVSVDTRPGDVTVHVGHVLHRAASPTGTGGRRAMYATFVQERAFDHVGPGQAINDVLFATADGGVLDDRGTAG